MIDPQRDVNRKVSGMNESHSAHKVKYIVYTWVPEERLDEWNDWHNQVHIPDVLRAGYMRAARKYRVTDTALPGAWQPQYATVYELDSMADLDAYLAGPGRALRQDYADRYGLIGQIARMVWEESAQF